MTESTTVPLPVPFARKAALWAPVVLWCGVIYAFSSMPDLSTGLGRWDLAARKAAHVLEFAALALLFGRAWAGTGRPASPTLLWGTLAFCFFYAVSDEWHQSFVPGRVGALHDVLIDTAGAWAAVAARRRFSGGFPWRRPRGEGAA